jgi:hypothetical protein
MLRLVASCVSVSASVLALGCGGNVVFVEDGAGGGGAGGAGAGGRTTNVATSVTNATSSETIGSTTSTTSSTSSTGAYCTNESCYFEVCDCYADCFGGKLEVSCAGFGASSCSCTYNGEYIGSCDGQTCQVEGSCCINLLVQPD